MQYSSFKSLATCQANVVFPCPLDDFITVMLLSSIDFLILFSMVGLLTGRLLTISSTVGFFPSKYCDSLFVFSILKLILSIHAYAGFLCPFDI